MLTNLIFLAAISSGSIGCALFFNKKYEDILPITCIGVVLILFIFGILEHLNVGFYVVLIIAFLIYLITAASLLKSREKARFYKFLQNILTPGMLVFVAAFFVLSVLNVGKMASSWDEFTHWIDIVKVMTTLDDFGTNPASYSSFQSYPPGMSLFQYFLQKCYLLCHPNGVFNEWRAYFAFQILLFSAFTPFFRSCSFKKPLGIVSIFAIVFLSPLVFYSNIYSATYIDAFVGAAAGAGFAAILIYKEKDIFYSVYICLLCSMLVLAKDVGLLFAIFLAAAYIADLALRRWERRRLFMCACGVLSATALPKLLWDFEIEISHAVKKFAEKIDISVAVQVLSGEDTSYRKIVLENYRNALLDSTISLGHTGIKLNYLCLIITLFAISFFIYQMVKERRSNERYNFLSTLILEHILLIFYIFGLCVLYMFRFSEYEAVRLASFSRYLGIAFLALLLTNFLLLNDLWTTDFLKAQNRQLLILYIIVLIIPGKPILDFITGETVESSKTIRARYETLAEKILDISDSNSTIYFISQENDGFDFWVTRYSVRPNIIPYKWNWSLGGPFYDGDIWSTGKSAEAWQNELVAEYDYVALYHLNDYFYATYGLLFEDPSQITENTVYKVNKDTKLLEKIK